MDGEDHKTFKAFIKSTTGSGQSGNAGKLSRPYRAFAGSTAGPGEFALKFGCQYPPSVLGLLDREAMTAFRAGRRLVVRGHRSGILDSTVGALHDDTTPSPS
jgi:hypothetical protein